MKHIVNLKHKERLNISEVETMMRSARSSNDYVLINFGNRGQWIKVVFCRDQTYAICYNFINVEFAAKLNYLLKQYKYTAVNKLSKWLTDWVNQLNRF